MSLRIQQQTLDNARASLAAHYPNSPLWEAKNTSGTNIYALINGISKTLLTAENFLHILSSKFIPLDSFFVEDWEKALSIPDCCFDGTGTLEERRVDVIIKLASMAVQTRQDFIKLAEMLGVAISINSGDEISSFDLSFPFLFFGTNAESTYTLVVTYSGLSEDHFPFTFDFAFGNKLASKLECIFKKQMPDNCKLIFRSE
jgi:uncharacterized protein YmfQ (DUF2313 family)